MNKINFNFIVALIVTLFLGSNLAGQQLPIFNHYSDNINPINPAFFSSNYSVDGYDSNISLTHRSQWLGLDGAPLTQNISAEFIYDKRNLILGGHLLNDKTGPLGQLNLIGKVGVYFAGRNLEDGAVSGALSIGYNQYRIDEGGIFFRDSEPAIIGQNVLYPDIGLGFSFFKKIQGGSYEGDIVYGGLSAPQIFNLQYNVSTNQDEKYKITRARHFYGNLGYTKYYDNNTYFEISSWLKYLKGSSFHVDMNIKYKMNDFFWLGAGASTNKAIQINSGVILNNALGRNSALKLGYTFTEYYNSNSVYFGNSHELTLTMSRVRKAKKYGF